MAKKLAGDNIASRLTLDKKLKLMSPKIRLNFKNSMTMTMNLLMISFWQVEFLNAYFLFLIK